MTSDPGFRIGDPTVMLVCVENRPSRLVDYSATLYCALGVIPPLAWHWLGCSTRQGKSSVILETADAADALSFFFGLSCIHGLLRLTAAWPTLFPLPLDPSSHSYTKTLFILQHCCNTHIPAPCPPRKKSRPSALSWNLHVSGVSTFQRGILMDIFNLLRIPSPRPTSPSISPSYDMSHLISLLGMRPTPNIIPRSASVTRQTWILYKFTCPPLGPISTISTSFWMV